MIVVMVNVIFLCCGMWLMLGVKEWQMPNEREREKAFYLFFYGDQIIGLKCTSFAPLVPNGYKGIFVILLYSRLL